MNSNQNTPYENLDPNVILDAVENAGFHCNGSLIALNSFENRVYQIGIEDSNPIIAKFYRPQRWSNETILEEHQFALELAQRELPVVAPLMNAANETLHFHQEFRFALFPRWGGHALELDNMEQLEWMGRFIGRMHAIGSCRPFQHRTQLTIENFGIKPYQFLVENQFIPDYLKANYCRAVETLLKKIEQSFQAAGEIRLIRIHGDMHAGNVLWNIAGPHIVDLDDCMMGPAMQDLWMLLSGDRAQIETQLDYILRGYQDFCDFNYAELHLIEALRALRQIHYSAWLARRWEDPAFPLNFPWFNTPSYWQEQLNDLQEQIYRLEQNSQSDFE